MSSHGPNGDWAKERSTPPLRLLITGIFPAVLPPVPPPVAGRRQPRPTAWEPQPRPDQRPPSPPPPTLLPPHRHRRRRITTSGTRAAEAIEPMTSSRWFIGQVATSDPGAAGSRPAVRAKAPSRVRFRPFAMSVGGDDGRGWSSSGQSGRPDPPSLQLPPLSTCSARGPDQSSPTTDPHRSAAICASTVHPWRARSVKPFWLTVPAAGVRVCAFAASDDMGGTVPSGGGSGRPAGVPGYGMGGTVPPGVGAAGR
jgi:hypothetical protein